MTPRRYRRITEALARRQPDLTVLLENVHKPHNFFAILRTCDAVGVHETHAVKLPEESLLDANHAARGSQKWVGVRQHPDVPTAIAHLREQNFQICTAHPSEDAWDYRQIDYTQPTAIVFGTEKWGVSAEALAETDARIAIPTFGMVESLNVSVAAAVILFEAQRQRLAAGFYDRVRLDRETYDKSLFEWLYPQLAASYREQGRSYPPLDSQGIIREESFGQPVHQS